MQHQQNQPSVGQVGDLGTGAGHQKEQVVLSQCTVAENHQPSSGGNESSNHECDVDIVQRPLEELQQRFMMKGVGAPSFFLGADIIPTPDDGEWHQVGVFQSIGKRTYVNNMLGRIATLAGVEQFKS